MLLRRLPRHCYSLHESLLEFEALGQLEEVVVPCLELEELPLLVLLNCWTSGRVWERSDRLLGRLSLAARLVRYY